MQPIKKQLEKGGAFRVLVGTHVGQGPSGCECAGCPKNHLYRQRNYTRVKIGDQWHEADPPEWDGDVVESAQDLCSRFNRENATKFERVAESVVQQQYKPQQPVYDSMTLAQLIAIAQEEEIDLKGSAKEPASKREDVLRLVKAHMSQTVAV